ncbi:MBL fold metallo-hydrolase [Isoptericola sp. NPDC056618]|uniref:MBL fold metallo-hydrolase n=1 Tax=Isoptericola sp. NPDC056618 TaxID=3345878 RepID=UPI0036AAB2C3
MNGAVNRTMHFIEVGPGVHRFEDTCAVYVVRALDDPGTAIAIDFGAGDVLDHLDEIGVDRLAAVLMTHHHRDQGQGLPRAVAADIPVWVPPQEVDLFSRVDEMWHTRTLWNDYNLRQDTFSVRAPVPVAGTVPEYRTASFGGVDVRTVPTPGHTMGSVTYLVERAGRRFAFTGDLIHSPGKVWSLAATQWSYTELEGPAMTVLSTLLLREEERADALLPSHGAPMTSGADDALALLGDRMQEYVDARRTSPWDLADRLHRPFVRLTEHLLVNRSADSCSYVLLSDDGPALFIDYGYDMTTGWPAGTDRAGRRPWLASLPALRREFGVTSVEVVLATHYHDDHIAGCNLLRDVEGTEVWVPEHVAPIMADPMRTDLPCQWFESTPADRVLDLGGTVRWREYEITTHDLPGHTRYAAAFEFVVDGVRVLATGDQQAADGKDPAHPEVLNYQYRNRFRRGDYVASAELYRRVRPDLLVTGHWKGRWVDDAYLDLLAAQGAATERLHHELQPEDDDLRPDDGNVALLEPYYRRVEPGATHRATVVVTNVRPETVPAQVTIAVPAGWEVRSPRTVDVEVLPHASRSLTFELVAPARPRRREVLAADVVLDGTRLGEACHAVVDVEDRSVPVSL